VFRILLHRLDAVLGGGLGFVSLTRQDDLAIGGFQTETEFSALVFEQLELCRHFFSSSLFVGTRNILKRQSSRKSALIVNAMREENIVI
jgi:hypothetical protein